ncbi:MAG TPA: hypothetical protein VGA44_09090, partial [Steroidobacteraceae bacterium]
LEASVIRTPPPGWVFNSAYRDDYESGLDRTNSVAGVAAYIRSKRARAQGSAALFQVIDAEPHRGKRLRVSAMLKSATVEDSAGVFVDVADGEGVLLFDTISQLTLRGTNGWARHAVVFDVPDNEAEITIGFALKGSGAVWADDFAFDVVDSGVPVTARLLKSPTSPRVEDPK